MNQKTRQDLILNKIKVQESVTTQELVDEFSVSVMTIRRDLQSLEKQGYITLNHGGAVWNTSSLVEHSIHYKRNTNSDKKQAIAKYCLSLVKQNELIFIETGTTAHAVAEELTKLENIKVFSNSLMAYNTLAKFDNIALFAVPGKYRELSDGFVGSITNQYIKQFCYDIAFVGTEGIDLNFGLSVPNIDDSLTKRSIIENSKKVILVADSSKFEKKFSYQICDFKNISCIVTDKYLDDSIFDLYLKHGIEIIRVNT